MLSWWCSGKQRDAAHRGTGCRRDGFGCGFRFKRGTCVHRNIPSRTQDSPIGIRHRRHGRDDTARGALPSGHREQPFPLVRPSCRFAVPCEWPSSIGDMRGMRGTGVPYRTTARSCDHCARYVLHVPCWGGFAPMSRHRHAALVAVSQDQGSGAVAPSGWMTSTDGGMLRRRRMLRCVVPCRDLIRDRLHHIKRQRLPVWE